MQRRLFALGMSLALITLLIGLNGFFPGKASANDLTATERANARPQAQLQITVAPWGPTQETIDAVKSSVAARPALQKFLRGTRNRLLHFGLIESDSKNLSKNPPNRFLATFYDYTNNRTVTAEGSVDKPDLLKIAASSDQPIASEEEFAEAVKLLERDQIISLGIRANQLSPYAPMPPVKYPSRPGDRVERTVYVGLEPRGAKGFTNEVVGVNLIRGTVIHYAGGAPETSRATPDGVCGIPSAGQSTTSNGTAGQFQFTISDGPTVLWQFLAVRPSASSGNSSERSGIELRDVKYRGKSVLKRINAPILNVDYDHNVCGPFRDWQYSEGMFQATGTDVAPGFRDCTTNVATTALESGNDTGNFRGVAFYQQYGEVVLVSEMNAGWYRYICEYRFAPDGTIRPRYGYGATANSCVCEIHTHHVYWRFDFDIGSVENEISPVSLRGVALGKPYATETALYRAGSPRNWLITSPTGDSYLLVPNENDGSAAAGSYGRGDVWILKYKESGGVPTELDDPNTNTQANIDAWANGESLVKQDIVVWYGAHYVHDDGGNHPERSKPQDFNILSGDHVQGPDLYPYRW